MRELMNKKPEELTVKDNIEYACIMLGVVCALEGAMIATACIASYVYENRDEIADGIKSRFARITRKKEKEEDKEEDVIE